VEAEPCLTARRGRNSWAEGCDRPVNGGTQYAAAECGNFSTRIATPVNTSPPAGPSRSIFRRKSWLLTAPYFISTAVKKENDQPRMIGNWPFFSSNVVVELIGLEPTTPCLQNLLRAFSGGHERQ
jgi:hypothetical protein